VKEKNQGKNEPINPNTDCFHVSQVCSVKFNSILIGTASLLLPLLNVPRCLPVCVILMFEKRQKTAAL